jgi:hypothetical protein
MLQGAQEVYQKLFRGGLATDLHRWQWLRRDFIGDWAALAVVGRDALMAAYQQRARTGHAPFSVRGATIAARRQIVVCDGHGSPYLAS